MLKRLLAQEFPERGDVEADEATSTFPDNAVLEEAALVLACIVGWDAPKPGDLPEPAGSRIRQKIVSENRE